jgi:hypothetical protein
MRTLHRTHPAGLLIVGLLLTGCGTAHAQQVSGPGLRCGTVTTAAGFPAVEQVVRGHVSCATATRVLTAYYAALAAGRAPGNGGGGPVQVEGWTCTSAPAMAAPLSTCDRGDSEITARAITH